MKKFINNPDDVVDEEIQGFVVCHRDLISITNNPRVLKYKNAPVKGKIGIVTGGGSGHFPAFTGYIGKNMIDAVAVGEVFSSPTSQAFYDAIKSANSGNGVLCLIGNFSGDRMNLKLASKRVLEEGIKLETVIVNDDVASASTKEREKRRGSTGEVLAWKVAGAKAALGSPLEEIAKTTYKAIDNTRSISVGLSPCTIPSVGVPNFKIEEGKISIGIGHHGEKGIKDIDLKPAKEVGKILLEILLSDLPFREGDEIVIMLSGLGATPYMELYILYNNIVKQLENEKIKIYKSYVGNFFTSLDMAGVTLTLMRLDEELKSMIDLEVDTVGLKQF